jgi:hypothetical protein
MICEAPLHVLHNAPLRPHRPHPPSQPSLANQNLGFSSASVAHVFVHTCAVPCQTGGGKFEKTICASSRAPRSSATSTATSNHAGSDAAGCDPKEGKENLQSAAQPKGSGKAHKHPHIATDSSATTDLNGRPPLNLIRKVHAFLCVRRRCA